MFLSDAKWDNYDIIYDILLCKKCFVVMKIVHFVHLIMLMMKKMHEIVKCLTVVVCIRHKVKMVTFGCIFKIFLGCSIQPEENSLFFIVLPSFSSKNNYTDISRLLLGWTCQRYSKRWRDEIGFAFWNLPWAKFQLNGKRMFVQSSVSVVSKK